MARLIYLVIGTGSPRGGQKVALRHVEGLRSLGYPAQAWIPAGSAPPGWIKHSALVEPEGEYRDDDIIVIPEDAVNWLKRFTGSPHRKIIFCQNHFYAGALYQSLPASVLNAYREYMACSETVALWLRRYVPHESVDVVPAFADERLFRPGEKARVIATTPSKRPLELEAIKFMLRRTSSDRPPWRWNVIKGAHEEGVAASLAEASIFLSMSKLEGLGMATLEAMASGCLVVGFTGQGGLEYAGSTNGFWVNDDDCDSCARRLSEAINLMETNRHIAGQMIAAGRRTASIYSHRNFMSALDRFWKSRLGSP